MIANPNVRARIYAAGRAVIVLAACTPELAGRRLVVEGRRVQAIRFGRLALLVSFVDGRAYAPEALERLRGDSGSLAREARLLERSVERARVHGSVLPMRLLTVFAHPELLENAACEHYARWSRALARLGAKRECVVHLFAGPHAPPGGAPYVLRIAQRAIRTGRAPTLKGSTPVVEHARKLWRECAALASSTRRLPMADARGALWSSAMLLDDRGIDALSATLERSAAAGAPLGITAYLEMPRAPFSFVSER